MTRSEQLHAGHWCGIGIERGKDRNNMGVMFRSAVCLGASFMFTIAGRYHRSSADTVRAWGHMPYVAYDNIEDFARLRPHDVPIIGVELHPKAKPLETYIHPRRALYLLGAEDNGLSAEAVNMCSDVVQFSSTYCTNVAMAGTIVLYDRNAKSVRAIRAVS